MTSRAFVLWGGPKVFAAGADIEDLQQLTGHDYRRVGRVRQDSLSAVINLSKVTIAAVNDYALGGGCELALSADLGFVGDDAVLGQPEILLGIIPGAGGVHRLQRIIGQDQAKDLILTGRRVASSESTEFGIGNPRVCGR